MQMHLLTACPQAFFTLANFSKLSNTITVENIWGLILYLFVDKRGSQQEWHVMKTMWKIWADERKYQQTAFLHCQLLWLTSLQGCIISIHTHAHSVLLRGYWQRPRVLPYDLLCPPLNYGNSVIRVNLRWWRSWKSRATSQQWSVLYCYITSEASELLLELLK